MYGKDIVKTWKFRINKCVFNISVLPYNITTVKNVCIQTCTTKLLFQLCDADPLSLNYGVCYHSKHTVLNRLWLEILGSTMWMENVL